MAETEYAFTNPEGNKITTRNPAAAAHMRFDLGFEESKPAAAKGDPPVAQTEKQ